VAHGPHNKTSTQLLEVGHCPGNGPSAGLWVHHRATLGGGDPLQKQVGLKGGTFKIAQLSDLHLSGIGSVEEVTLNHLKALQPDLILLTGDVIGDRHALPALEDFLKSLPNAIKVAIGKHELFTPRSSGRYTAGSYQTAWGNLHVSRGIGTSMIPLRIGARPEIVLLELK